MKNEKSEDETESRENNTVTTTKRAKPTKEHNIFEWFRILLME